MKNIQHWNWFSHKTGIKAWKGNKKFIGPQCECDLFVVIVLPFCGDNGALFWREKKAGTVIVGAITGGLSAPLPCKTSPPFSFTVTSGSGGDSSVRSYLVTFCFFERASQETNSSPILASIFSQTWHLYYFQTVVFLRLWMLYRLTSRLPSSYSLGFLTNVLNSRS